MNSGFFVIMKNYVEIIFEDISTERSELLIAELSESGYEGFEEDSNILKAFILENQFDEAVLNGIAEKYRVIYYSQVIADTKLEPGVGIQFSTCDSRSIRSYKS